MSKSHSWHYENRIRLKISLRFTQSLTVLYTCTIRCVTQIHFLSLKQFSIVLVYSKSVILCIARQYKYLNKYVYLLWFYFLSRIFSFFVLFLYLTSLLYLWLCYKISVSRVQHAYSGFRKHYRVLSSCMTRHRIAKKSNATGVTSGAVTTQLSGAPDLSICWGSCYSICSVLCHVLSTILCLLVLFLGHCMCMVYKLKFI